MIYLEYGNVQGADGLPIVPGGYMELYLSGDGQVIAAPYGQVLGGNTNFVRFYFDENSNLITPAQIWSNAELTPQSADGYGTHYVANFYDADGTRLNNSPMKWIFPGANGTTADISNMVSVQNPSTYYPSPFILLPEPANYVMAGPVSGSPAIPNFRPLVPADLPVATASALGAVQPDNVTITVTDGVLTAVGGGGGGGITVLTGDVTAGPGSGSQVATLANTAVTPGSYTLADITVDSKGRVTAASNGTVPQATLSTYGIVKPDGASIVIFDGIISAVGGGGGGAVWGAITGTLSSQTDLQNALNAKANLPVLVSKTSSYTTFPTDNIILVSSTGATSIFLQTTGLIIGWTYTVKNNNTGLVTVGSVSGTVTIDGQLHVEISQYQSLDMTFDGTSFSII